MIETVDHYFFSKSSADHRIPVLREFLDGYVLYGDIDLTLRCYGDWVNSNRVVWPYAHGRLQQPEWVRHNFDILEAIDELRRLESKRPTLQGLPNVDSLFGATETEGG